MTEFFTTPLEELADLSGGFAFKSKDYAETGRFILRTLNITDDGTINKDQAVYLPLDLCPNYKRFELQENDTLFVMVGATLGKIGWIQAQDLPALLNQNMWRIRAKPNLVDPRFLNYAFRIASAKSLNWASGSARAFVRRDDYRKLSIPNPPIVTQRAISNLLGALDDKIENNRRMNETLEEMARAIFKSWFVDFDPVHAKAAGNAPAHMDAETAALFPNSFGDDGLPMGWKELNIGSVVEVRNGLSYKGKFLSDTGADMVNLGCFGFKGKFKAEKIKSYRGEYKDRHKIRPGDLVFANTDMTQDRAILCSPIIVPSYINANETIFSHHVSHVHELKPQHPAFKEFLRQCMMTQNFRIRAEGYATGTTVLAVPKDIFDGYYFPIPSDEILNVFFEFISGISKKLEANYEENQTLTELRDTLLPKLMSGEIRVKDAKREVEAAV